LTQEEFKKRLGYNSKMKSAQNKVPKELHIDNLPDSVDWRTKNAVTNVKD
jgi:hypothetical protein